MDTAETLPHPVRAILTIAGSDPSGGAGIQADLKTFASLKVYGAAAITCLTVQNTTGVFATNPVDSQFVREQAEKVLADIQVSHIKLGMLGNRDIVRAVGKILADFSGEVVCDPILSSSSGKTLLHDEALDDFKTQIISRATALTPNFLEFQVLTGITVDEENKINQAISQLFTEYPRLTAVVLKGGHRQEKAKEVTDTLYLRDEQDFKRTDSRRPRIITNNTHGTGCTFASALAAGHQKTGSWQESFHLACNYLDQLLHLSSNHIIGHGTGPLLHHLYKD